MKHRTGYLYQRGNVYWLQYRVEGRVVRQSLDTTARAEAEKKQKKIMRPFMAADRTDALVMVQAKLANAKDEAQIAIDDAHPPLAVADAWAAYEQTKNRPDSSERTLQGYETSWRKFAGWLNKTHPDKTFMRDIAADAARAYAQQLTTDGLTASTFNQYIGLLRLVWRCLAEQIRGTVNPWMQIAKRRTQKLAHRRRTITPEQFDNLLKAADDADYHDLFFVLGMTGQRLVDGLMLRWDSIDFKRRVITLNPRKTARTGKAVFIPLLPALAELLQKRRDMVAGNLVFPDLAAAYDHDSSAISKRVQEAFTKAGLKPNENRPGVKRAVTVYGAHSLRHFFATQALSAGIPGEIVKRITGHSSDAMLEGYEHVDAAMISGLAAKLGNGKHPLSLPAPQAYIREKVRAALGRMNGKNWKTVKAELLTLTN